MKQITPAGIAKISLILTVLLYLINILQAAVINIPGDFDTIQAGIDASVNGDTVRVAQGFYVEHINFQGKGITVTSWYPETWNRSVLEQTVINGNNDGHVVCFNSGENSNARLIGFTITNGNAEMEDHDGKGGGIYCEGSSPSLSYLIVRDNNANDGGGIAMYNTSPELLSIELTGNSCNMSGGGILCTGNSYPRLTNLLIHHNYAFEGAGIQVQNDAEPVVNQCTIVDNLSDVSDYAGGINCFGNCEIVVMNTILWGNSVPQILSTGELSIAHSCIQSGQNGIQSQQNGQLHWLNGNVAEDPLFAGVLEQNYHLLDISPCIEAGSMRHTIFNEMYFSPVTDLEHNLRPMPSHTQPDLGALEHQGVVLLTTSDTVSPMPGISVYPNPVRGTAHFQMQHKQSGPVRLSVYTLKGQLVFTSSEQKLPEETILWKGTDQKGRTVPTGLYLYRLETESITLRGKFVFLR